MCPKVMHVLRNPHGFSEDEVRTARLWAGDRIEQLERALRTLLTHWDVEGEAMFEDAVTDARKILELRHRGY